METVIPAYRIFPIGDAAVTIDFGNVIDTGINSLVIQLFNEFRANPFAGMVEVIPAYSSLSFYYDVLKISKAMNGDRSVFDFVSRQLVERLSAPLAKNSSESRNITIPVCYEPELAPDITWLAREKNISIEEVVRIHSARPYRVYMLGFLPGFSYMGETDERIAVGRKSQPQPVMAGSIGIAGRQTGIYPSASPGGWQIIGRTPLKLFEADKEEPTLLRAGDSVQFIPISKNEFENY